MVPSVQAKVEKVREQKKKCQDCNHSSSFPLQAHEAIGVIAGDLVEIIQDISYDHFDDAPTDRYIDTWRKVARKAGAMSACKTPRPRPSGKLKGWGQLIEICTHEDSTLGVAAGECRHTQIICVTKQDNFGSKQCNDMLKQHIRDNPGISVHGSLPCTDWSAWQMVAVHRNGPKYLAKLQKRRKESEKLVDDFIEIAELALSLGGEVSFEWPKDCAGWQLQELANFIMRNSLYTALPDGCASGMCDTTGTPMLKPWRFIRSSKRLAVGLHALQCRHDKAFRHGKIAGSATKDTERYPIKLSRTYITSLFGDPEVIPGLPCCAVKQQAEHRSKEPSVEDFGATPMTTPVGVVMEMDECLAAPSISAAVTKLLQRNEWTDAAYDAVRAEGGALLESGTWLESSVCEKDDLIKTARDNKEKIHLGDLLTICSIKFFERGTEFWKLKGRICFRGDTVKDEDGAVAVFQEIGANPTAVQGVNANVAYGCIPGHSSSVADAIRAYVQSLLKSKHKTWVHIPKELWPKSWHGKYSKPMCLLVKALYGHPESGGDWENHLTEAVKACGGKAVENHPSTFWFEAEKCLLTVYVDDFLLSGPTGNHEVIWNKLRYGTHPIACEDPEPLSHFLGRNHVDF